VNSALRLRRGSAPALLVLFLAGGLFGVRGYVDNFQQYRGFPPPREPAWLSQPGSVQRLDLPSPALGGRRQEVYVYLQSGYAAHPQQRYPVLYLLHGFPGRPLAFLETVQMGVVDYTLSVRGRTQPVILVMPFGSTGTFNDQEWVDGAEPHSDWATFVARDVVRAVDHRYRTIPTRGGRAIAGLSEGGYGALDIALRHPHEFSVVESWSGYERPDPIRSIFGSDLQLLTQNDPRLLVRRDAPTLRRLHTYFWFYTGSTDRLRRQNVAFAHELDALRVPHRFRLVYGGHTWAQWRDNARLGFIAGADHLARD
jgi:enterochelin esterase-like enzyme